VTEEVEFEDEFDREEYDHAYVFTIKHEEDGPAVDVFFDATPLANMTPAAVHAAAKLTGMMDEKYAKAREAMVYLDFRVRMDGAVCGPYLVKSYVDITRDVMEKVLRAKSREELKTFLEGAKL
jgi:hypothetical protein